MTASGWYLLTWWIATSRSGSLSSSRTLAMEASSPKSGVTPAGKWKCNAHSSEASPQLGPIATIP